VFAIEHFPKQGGFFWHLPLCRGFFQTEKSAKKRVFPNRGVFKELGGESAVPGVFEGKKNRNPSEKTGFFDQKSSIYPRNLTFEGRNLRFHEKQLFFLILRAFQGVTRGKTRFSARPQALIQASLPRPSPAKTPSKQVPNGAQTHRFWRPEPVRRPRRGACQRPPDCSILRPARGATWPNWRCQELPNWTHSVHDPSVADR